MKQVLLLIVLFISVEGFAQKSLDNELLLQTPNCENVAFNSSRLIEKYFNHKDYDSVLVVTNRWNEFCGITEPLFRVKVLQQIQRRQFSEEWINNEYFLNYIFLYADRLEYSKAANAKLVYEQYKISFGYIPLNSSLDDLTVIWANALVESNDLQPIERAFCLLYSNKTQDFWQMLKDHKLVGTKLQNIYDEKVQKTKKMPEGNLGVMIGIMLPFGNLADVVGVKPAFGFQFGLKSNKLQYDLTVLLRTGKAKQDYLVMYQGALKSTDYYLGGYVGLDVAYELWRGKRQEFDFLTGIAYDGFDAVESNTEKDIKGKTINSLNLTLGLGYRFYGKRFNYWGIQTKYNVVNYNNKQGTDLSGDYLSLILTYNFFGNFQKRTMMERLKMK